jgi:His/Glu/Gln/Arg/opine family amino acid ABC transporter permease subunit
VRHVPTTERRDTILLDYTLYLLPGALVALEVIALAVPLGLLISVLVALARRSSIRIVSWFASAYIELIRGTPCLLQLFYVFYVLPFFGLHLEPLEAGVVGLGINFGAYGAEVLRTGIEAVPRSQIEAGLVLGMSPLLVMRRVIWPQAIRVVLAPLGNLVIELMKGTALVSLVRVDEILFHAQRLVTMTFRFFEVYSLVAVIFFLLCFPASRLVAWLERRLALP